MRQETASRYLVTIYGDPGLPVLPLKPGELILGRSPNSSIGVAFYDSTMSRDHARLSWATGGTHTVTDCGSKNGTWHNGESANERALQAQDILRLGRMVFVATSDRPQGGFGDVPAPGRSTITSQRQLLAATLGPTRQPLLLIGESGVGKESTARQIHEASRLSGEIVVVNCAIVPPLQLERALFGVVGAFATADRGTLVLKHIGSLPTQQQRRLVDQLGEVGDRVRVIATSMTDLATLRHSQALIPALAEILEPGCVVLPALRDHKEDLVLMVDEMAQRTIGRRFEKTTDFVEAIALHHWPGNLRELTEVMLQALSHAVQHGDFLTLSSLPDYVAAPLLTRVQAGGRAPAPSKERLAQLLQQYDGNVRRIALALKRTRKQIYRWMTRYELDPNAFRQGDEAQP